MCGIIGYITKKPITKQKFSSYLNTIISRGPDAGGIKEYIKNDVQVLLGNRRLAFLDLRSTADMPMVDETGRYTITYNGEIYNFHSIRKELEKRKYKFSTTSDTEVILKGYIEYGQKIIEKLSGMFAFAIYDKEKNTITFARDHFGKKPLYYYVSNNSLMFASELKAITANPTIGEQLTISKESIVKFLMYGYIPSPDTIYNEVKKLEPSTTFQFDVYKWKIVNKYEFWHLENTELDKDITASEALEKLDQLLHAAVKERLIADVPLGSFLSGGIDSSLITSIASVYYPGIETFTVVYADEELNEFEYAKQVARELNVHPNFYKFKDSLALPLLDEVLDYMDEPMADASLLPTTFIAKKTKTKVKAALSGDGGDELFGGYPKYNAQLLSENLKSIGKALSRMSPASSYLPLGLTKKQAVKKAIETIQYDSAIRHFILGSGSFLYSELTQLITDPKLLNLTNIFEQSLRYASMFKQKDLGNKLLFLDARIQLPDWYLVKVDRASMSQSLEVRSPLLDKELAEFMFSLPSKYKFTTQKNKLILKTLAERYIPKDIINRPKKGFGLPLNRWIRQNFRKQIEDTIYSLDIDIINNQYVQKMWDEFIRGKQDHGTKIWRLFILGSFLKKYGKV